MNYNLPSLQEPSLQPPLPSLPRSPPRHHPPYVGAESFSSFPTAFGVRKHLVVLLYHPTPGLGDRESNQGKAKDEKCCSSHLCHLPLCSLCPVVAFRRRGKNRNCLAQPPKQEFPTRAPHPSGSFPCSKKLGLQL